MSNRYSTYPAVSLYNNRHLLVLCTLIALIAGVSALTNLPRLEDPRITPRYPQITTFLPGASAARMEALVTDPIEDSLREISEIKDIQSSSIAGVSIVNVELEDKVSAAEIEGVFSEIQNQINNVQSLLPPGTTQPDFDKNNNAVAFSKIVAVNWTLPGPPQLGVMNRLAEGLADKIRVVPGTKLVRVYGAPTEEIDVQINSAEMAALSISAAQVAQAIANADVKLPAGVLRSNNTNVGLEVGSEIDSLERIRRIPLNMGSSGNFRTIGDIAEVEKKWQTPEQDIIFTNGNRSVLVAALTDKSTRLDLWTAAANEAVDSFNEANGGGLSIETVFDQNIYTEERLSSLGNNLLFGAFLVMVVVLLSMGWKAALIVGSALPLSGALALFGLSAMGQQIHQMAIFGMIIAIGLLIDNAIVMTDQIKKHLDKNMPPLQAMTESIAHLFVPLLTSTLTTVLGFMPVFLLDGAMGDFVGPIATSVILALLASFLIGMTLVPAFGAAFLHANSGHSGARSLDGDHLNKGKASVWWRDGVHSSAMDARYRRWLKYCLRRSGFTVAACLLLPALGFWLSTMLGQQFFPPADRNQFDIEVRMDSVSSIARTQERALAIETVLRAQEGVKEVHWRIGGTYPTLYYNRIMRESRNDSFAHAVVYTDSIATSKRLTGSLPQLLSDQFTDAQIIVAPFAQGPPANAPIGFKISGTNLDTLRQYGEELRLIMHSVPGIVATRASIAGGEANLDFKIDEYAARQAGFNLTQIARQMESDLEGRTGGAMLDDLEELPVRVRVKDAERSQMADINGLMFALPGSTDWMFAEAIGNFELTPESSSISRHDGRRINDVLGYIAPGALPIDVSNDIVDAIKESGFKLPPGYKLIVDGESADQGEALKDLMTYLPVLVMLMLASLILSFRSVPIAMHIVVIAVLSVGLGFLCLSMGGFVRGFNAIIGSIGLVGVAINGTIVVLAAIRSNPLASAGDVDAIVSETVNATRHIVSTTLTTVCGFLPLLFSGGDFWPPLAIVIAGGVGLSITLSLAMTPAVYYLLATYYPYMGTRARAVNA